MKRRGVLGVGVVLGAAAAVRPPVSDADLAVARALFAAGAYDRLGRLLPRLLDGAEHRLWASPAGAARAAGVWVLASQLAVKQSRTSTAGAYAGLAGAAARRCGNAAVLAAAARAGATPLRRTGHTRQALALLQETRDRLTALSRPSAAELDAAAWWSSPPPTPLRRPIRPRSHGTSRTRPRRRPGGSRAFRTTGGRRPLQLAVGQCTLFRIGIHRHLGDLDTALAHAARLDLRALLTAERRARAATDTARALLDAGDISGAFTQLRRVELAAPGEASRPSVRALTAEVAAARPGPGRLRPPHHARGQHRGRVKRLRTVPDEISPPPRPRTMAGARGYGYCRTAAAAVRDALRARGRPAATRGP